MAEKVTKLAFEKYYHDDSGVRAAVRYDSTVEEGKIEMMSVSEDWTASFPVSDLDWLLGCLQRIRDEL